MNKRIIYVLGGFLLFGMLSGMEHKRQEQPYILNVVLLLDVGGESDIGATSQALLAAIRDNVPFIASSRLLSNILRNLDTPIERQEEYKKLFTEDFFDTSKWALFTNEMDDFVIALPKGFWPGLDVTNSENFPVIGLNKDGVKAISMNFDAFTALFKEAFTKPAKIAIDSLKDLFVNENVRKRIYVTGHGSEDKYLYKNKGTVRGWIAGLSVDQYKTFLTFLNEVGTDLLYVNSCFIGGIHSLTPYMEQVGDISIKPRIDYFLIIGGITDTFVYNSYDATNFKDFFKGLNEFFSPKGSLTKNPFRSFVTYVWTKESTRNIPSVRFPGSEHYFKVINVDEGMYVITQAMVTAHVLKEKGLRHASSEIAQLSQHIKKIEEKGEDVSDLGQTLEKKLFGWKAQERQHAPIIIPNNKDFVILYPFMVSVPLVIDRIKMLPFLSMIPGNAFHYMKEIDAGCYINDALLEAFYHYEIASTKAFFIENIFAFNSAFTGIPYEVGKKVNFKNIFITGNAGGGFVILKVDDTYYQANFTYEDEDPVFTKIITDASSNFSPIFVPLEKEKAEQHIIEEMRTFPMLPETVQFLGGKEYLKKQVQKIMKKWISDHTVDVSTFNFLK